MRNNGRAQRRRRVPPKKRGAHYVQNRCETRVNYENFITDDFNDWWVGWACYERGSWLALVTAKSMNEWALGREAHFRFDVVRRCDASLWKRKEITQPRSNHQVHFRLKRPFCLLKNLKKNQCHMPFNYDCLSHLQINLRDLLCTSDSISINTPLEWEWTFSFRKECCHWVFFL